jgi:hydrophobe/amphiphile efflux-1 (HAE1) family protein
MNVSALFIRRPVATTLLAIAMFLAGSAAFRFLPIAPLPRVDFPTISVSASLPGADPETMASSVATPLERRFGRIAGVTEITSTSSLANTSITLQFDLDRNVDAAARDVQAAINAAGGELPPNLPTRPNFKKVNPADSPILILSLHSDSIPLSQVFDQANTILAQKIAQVDGVGQVFVGGGQQPAVRIQADPLALAGAGLTLEDLRKSMNAMTSAQPKGQVAGAQVMQSIGINDQLFGAKAFAPMIISYQHNSPIRLQDVARVFDDVENDRVAGWVKQTRTVLLIIRRQPDANILSTIDNVLAEMPRLRTSISPGITLEVVTDRATTIRASVHDVERTLVISVLLVVLVVFVFLRSARATLIPSVAVPLSIVGTFGVMYLLGYSLDNLSLMALTISTGFVVDDAIVVTENISRFIEEGDPPLTAALKGAQQIGFTIISITLSLLAVFLPILMMGGIVGRLFREFAVTLSIAIAMSALVSLTLTPMMCGRLLRNEEKKAREPLFYRMFEWGFDSLLNVYEYVLRWVLEHSLLMLLVTFGTIGLTIYLFIIVPKGLFPQQDTGMIMGFSEAAQESSFAAMKSKQEELNRILSEDPDIGPFVSFIGGGGNAVNTGTVFASLKPMPPRKATADQVIARLRPNLAKIEGANLYLQAVQDLRVGGRGSRTQYQYTLQDANLAELETWAPKVMDALKKLPQLRDVATDQQLAALQLMVNIDRDTASRLGLSPQVIDNTLYDAFGQRQVTLSFNQVNEYRSILEVAPQYLTNPDALKAIYVRSPAGGPPVPLTSIAKAEMTQTALSVNHQGQFASVTISFNLAPNASLGQAIDAVDKARVEIGLPPSISASFSGTAQAFTASLANEKWLVLAAILAVYIVLGMLYESLIHPVTILSTIPSAGVGALLALLLTGTDFSIIALIGIILLIGIVKKNAILMIDFALEAEREQGLSTKDAIYLACRLRFRPIMMTTMAALFGALPLALGHGPGSELRYPLGVAIVGGLIVSQMLTLFTTPVIYLYMDRLSPKAAHGGAPELEELKAG